MILPPPGAPVAFERVRVFDGASVHEDRTVLVADGTIVAVLPSDETPPIRDAVVRVPGGGRTLLPGLIDSHVHIRFFDAVAVLRAGVTTVRDLGWPLVPIRVLAEETARAPARGPRVLFAGPMLTAPGGYPARAAWAPAGTARQVASEAEGRAAVRELLGKGAAVIKVAQDPRVGPTLPAGVLAAIVGEAHEAGARVVSHCAGLEQLELALEAGVDELAHGLWSEEAIPDELLARMVARGVVVVPTLHVGPSEVRVGNVRRFAEAGGRVIYGTDMGNPPAAAGIDVEELRLLCAAGFTPRRALAAATGDAADHLGLGDRGWVEPGAVADLVLVEGDPLEDLDVLARPVLVMREGTAVA